MKSEEEKQILCINTYRWYLKKWCRGTYSQSRNGDASVENGRAEAARAKGRVGFTHTHTHCAAETESWWEPATRHRSRALSSVMAQTERPGAGRRSAREGWVDTHRWFASSYRRLTQRAKAPITQFEKMSGLFPVVSYVKYICSE